MEVAYSIQAEINTKARSSADYRRKLNELKCAVEESRTHLDQLQVILSLAAERNEIDFLREKMQSILALIANMLAGLRKDPPSNPKNNSHKTNKGTDKPGIQLSLLPD